VPNKRNSCFFPELTTLTLAWPLAGVGTFHAGGVTALAVYFQFHCRPRLHCIFQWVGRSRSQPAGCDLDCGQDLFRLSQALHERHISHLNLAIWSSADMSQMSLPAFEILPPSQPVTGWVAISLRSLRLGDVFHASYPPDAFSWLTRRQPVDKIGKTIFLYYFPSDATAGTASAPSSESKWIP
jgi:hypothetical protein